MRVYLDVCCLNRPFDDQRQPRIRMEAEAVALILERIDGGEGVQVLSQVAGIEIAAMTDSERRRRVRALLPVRKDRIRLTPRVYSRAEVLITLGFHAADALHVVSAEAAQADVMLTCDDHICRLGKKHQKRLTIRVANPLQWIQENWDAPNS